MTEAELGPQYYEFSVVDCVSPPAKLAAALALDTFLEVPGLKDVFLATAGLAFTIFARDVFFDALAVFFRRGLATFVTPALLAFLAALTGLVDFFEAAHLSF